MSRGAASRRLVLLMVGAVMAAIMIVLVAMVPEKAEAAGRFKIVKKTFSNTGQIVLPITRNSATPYPAEIDVRGLKRGKIRDVNLTLKGFSHTFPADVDVMVSHGGVTRTVMSDVGSSFDVSNITLKLDDEAANFLSDTSQISGGTFLPTNNLITDTFVAPAPVPSGRSELAGFDGKKPNGSWALWVMDDFPTTDEGQIAGGWSLQIKAKVRR